MFIRILQAGIALMFINSASVADGVAGSLARQEGAQARVMWFDAEANMKTLSSQSGVQDIVEKSKSANINTNIVDEKPVAGTVLYNSEIAPKINAARYPKGYDLLQTMIDDCKKARIPVYAAINVFSEGSKKAPGGPAYKHLDWQCIQYEVERVLSV